MKSERDIDVSVILPVHNEREHLPREVERIREALDSSPYTYEVIVVDDGSTDGSGDEAAQIDGIRLIRFTQNRGSGAARKTGTHAARGRTIVWTDVDMTYPNEEIPRLVKELEGHDQVVGARTSEQGTMKALRVPAKWLIRRLASYLSEMRIPDLNSGFRAFRTEVARQYLHMLPKGFSCVSTITLAFLTNGYSVKYIPIEYHPRAGESKFHPWADTKRYITQVIRMILSFNPLRVFLPVGFVMLGTGIGKLIYDWTTRDFSLAPNTLLIMFAAFQVIAIGLLADLVVRSTKPAEEVDPAATDHAAPS